MVHAQPSQGPELLSNSPTPTPPTSQQSPSPTGRKNALQLQLSSSSSGAPPSKHDAQADNKLVSRSASPFFAVTLARASDDHDKEQQEPLQFATSSLVSPGPSARTFSPSPLLWSHGGWHAGHFSFDEGADNGSEDKGAAERDEDEQEAEAARTDKGREGASAESSSSVGSVEGHDGSSASEESTTTTRVKEEQATPRIKSATIPISKMLRSSLTPTAAPFVFKPKATSLPTTTSAPISSHPRLAPLVTSLPAPSSAVPSHVAPSPTQDFDYLSLSQSEDLYDVGDQYDYSRREESEWQLDEHGNLVNLDGEGKYSIAEDILQLQSAEATPSTTTTINYGGRVHTKMPGSSTPASYLDQGRRASESSLASSSSWCPPRPQIPFPSTSSTYFPATPPFSNPNSPERSRTSSISSQHSYFSPRAPSTIERLPTAAQLQSYFGPSPVDVCSPYAHAFDLAAGSLPPSPSALRDFPSYGSSSSSTVSSIAYQTDPEDILYTEARETFIQHSFATLSSTPTAANRQSMTAHFDRAMHSPFPLATLYGLTPEAATQLAADPARSGVADNVLKLALIRGQQQRLAGAAGLGGPSANNRKLGLYKTELCRSWEEKGSCRYGAKCQFAHGQHEVREVARHPKFKSEVCRTFWLHGSCPYGRRCCFIHTTVPGGAATPSGPASESLAPSSTALTSSSPVATAEPNSRIGQRMSTTSSAAVAAAVQASTRGFGPALANYLGPTSTPPSISPSASYHNSPVETRRYDFGSSGNGGNGNGGNGNGGNGNGGYGNGGYGNGGKAALGGSAFDSSTPLIGFGLKPPGRFTTNPSEVPPTFQDPPKSRLERLGSLPTPGTPRSAQASFELNSPLFGVSRGPFSNGGGLNYTFAPAPTTPASPSPHTRHSSNSSFSSVATSSSTSSLGLPRMSSASYSPFLPRTDSNSSLSSLGGASTYSTFTPLQPVGGDWVTSSSSNCKGKSGVLDWDTTGLEDEEDLTFAETSQEYVPAGGSTGEGSTSTDYHHQYGMMEGLGSLSLSIDRSAEMTPLGVK